MSYGYDNLATWARAGSYVDRILRGASPAELPVEQVDAFKAARAVKFEVPPMLLSRADGDRMRS
jgi:putative ABC transport system substrate-binding protein